jgi:WD40 repeat protein
VNGALYQSYSGHSSHVTNLRFNYNQRFLLSCGGRDRTILLWKHEVELAEDSDDNASAASGSTSSSSKSMSSMTAGMFLLLDVCCN